MSQQNSVACSEYDSMSRRSFFSKSASAALAVSAPFWLPKVSYASNSRSRDAIVSVYLRGGFDGLTMCAPFFEESYYTLRPTLAVARPDSSSPNRGIDLDGKFALPPAMASLKTPFDNGDLLFVHAVGSANWTRSHFDAQRWMERGLHGASGTGEGWLAKYLRLTPPAVAEAQLRGVSMTFGMRQTMEGAPLSLPIGDVRKFGYRGGWVNQNEIVALLQDGYRRAETEMLRNAARETDRTIGFLDQIGFNTYQPAGGATYPETLFGIQMKATAALLKAGVGVEAVHLDLEGWDTHSNQGPFDGHMRNLMQDVANAMHAFWLDMSSSNNRRWTMVVMSEFGRNVRENASKGTDHGTANAMMVLGPNVQGRRVLTQWPGIHPDQLFEGVDLAPTIDHRDILAEILVRRAGLKDVTDFFPGFTPTMRGVVR